MLMQKFLYVPDRVERKIIGRDSRKSTVWRVGCGKGIIWRNRPEGVGCTCDECGF